MLTLLLTLSPLTLSAQEEADTLETGILFRQGMWRLDLNYKGNGQNLQKYVDHYLTHRQHEATPIYIWGYASPEGGTSFNQQLSLKRAHEIAAYLQHTLSLPDSMIIYQGEGVDWKGLYEAVLADAHVPYRNDVLALINNVPDAPYSVNGKSLNQRKHKLATFQQGEPWRYMYSHIFPALRRTGVRVVCILPKAPQPETDASKDNAPDTEKITDTAIGDTVADSISVPINTDVLPAQEELSYVNFIKIKNNLLFDAALVANLGAEFGFCKHWSIDIPFYYSPYNINSMWRLRLRATQPELRYWFRNNRRGHYVGLHAHVASFNASWGSDYRYQNPNGLLWGAGVGYGFAFPLGQAKRWGMEVNLGAGFADYHYIKYLNGNNGAEVARGKGRYLGITRAGLSVYYLLNLKKERRVKK